ncbi:MULTISPECIES: hypothetical protein [Salinibaculum]|uniref:hypothetical protein n=1 Tax=Salinibaculum TaxID=2732368 RepID=UPI0030CFD616
MSEDSNPDRGKNRARTDESAVGRTTSPDRTVAYSREEWEELASDPDLRHDLGYDLAAWEQFRTLDGSEQLMFLPEDEELIHDDAFVVADEDAIVDLGGRC